MGDYSKGYIGTVSYIHCLEPHCMHYRSGLVTAAHWYKQVRDKQ